MWAWVSHRTFCHVLAHVRNCFYLLFNNKLSLKFNEFHEIARCNQWHRGRLLTFPTKRPGWSYRECAWPVTKLKRAPLIQAPSSGAISQQRRVSESFMRNLHYSIKYRIGIYLFNKNMAYERGNCKISVDFFFPFQVQMLTNIVLE